MWEDNYKEETYLEGLKERTLDVLYALGMILLIAVTFPLLAVFPLWCIIWILTGWSYYTWVFERVWKADL